MKRSILCLSIALFCSWSLYGQSDWTKKANFPGVTRAFDVAFSIGHYGFVGVGRNCSNTNQIDFYKYNTRTNTWSAITNYPGNGQYGCSACTIEGKGYVGLGWSGNQNCNDFWRYDTISKGWTQMATFPGTPRYSTSPFVIGHKAYFVGGSPNGPPYFNDVWVYDAHQNTWTQLRNYPETGGVESYVSFAIGKHGYVGDGYYNPGCYSSMYEYDTASDTWTAISPIPAAYGVGGDPGVFCLGSKAYVVSGTECTTIGLPDGWVYDTVTKSWCEFSYLGGSKLSTGYGAAFAADNHGYICTGYDTNQNCLNGLWEYTPSAKFTVSDTVACNADTARFSATTNFLSPTWSWSFPGGSPAISNLQNPAIIYANPGTYSVTLIVSACGGIDTVARTITIKSTPIAGVGVKGKPSICIGIADTLVASGGGTYLWSNGATTSSVIVSPNASATYTVKVTKGCSKDTSISVTVNPTPLVSLTGGNTICEGDSTTLSATGGGTYKWSNGSTSASTVVNPNITSTYSLTVTSNKGCPKDTSIKVTVTPLPSISISGKNTICLGDSTTLFVSGGGTYKWSTGATTSSITLAPHNTSVYVLDVSNNGCSKDTNILITVSTLTAAITAPLTICQGDSVTLYTSGGGTYKWSTGSSTSSILVKPAATTTYSVIITNGACVKDTSVTVTIEICSTSGIENYHGASSLVNVFPNPNNGVFTLQSSVVSGQSSVEVYNVLGEKIYSQSSTLNSQFSINISNQPNGVYLYRITTQEGSLIGEGKIVKQ